MPENRLSEEFFQHIFLQAGDGIFLIDDQAVMIEVNPRGCEILGYTRDELLGQPVMKFHPPDAIEHIMNELARLATDKLVVTESAFIRKDGTRIPVEITGKLLSNNQIIGLLRDITGRKRTERILSESEEKFRSLVEHSPDGIILVDEKGDIVEWNGGQERISGLKRSVVLGKPYWDIWFRLQLDELRSDALLEQFRQETLDTLGSGGKSSSSQPYEMTFQLPDKTRRNVEIMCYTYKTGLGYRMGSIVRDISKRKQVEMLLEHLAMHDGLTDLPNRQLLQDRLEHAMDHTRREPRGMVAVMMLDIDHFKVINDTYGHACGDQILRAVSQRLQNCLRRSDTAARMGGDEFTLVMVEVKNTESCMVIAQKVLETISEPMEIDGHVFRITTSIGVSLFSSGDLEAATLLRQADLAMYQAKQSRNCYQFYHSS